MAVILRYLYSGLFYVALPWVLLRHCWRTRHTPSHARRWRERLAWIDVPQQHSIWLHAVSFGEFIAALPLIEHLLEKYPHYPMLITTTTATGSQRVQEVLGTRVLHYYLPYDLPGVMQRFLTKTQPRLGIIMETELWPNVLALCQRQQIPLLLANARLSLRSARGYRRIAWMTRAMLPALTCIAAQSPTDAARFIGLGAEPSKVHVAGNLKFNQAIPATVYAQATALRAQWGATRPVWIAASTHEGEELHVLAAHARIRQSLPEALLLLVPRHPHRFQTVAQLARQHGYCVQQRSQGDPDAQCDVFIGDSMGELLWFYAAADVAFVGGSLVAIGGHNPLEPIAIGRPSLMGPHVFNMQAIAEMLLAERALWSVHDATSLANAVLALLTEPQQGADMVARATQLLDANRDALAQHAYWVDKLLG